MSRRTLKTRVPAAGRIEQLSPAERAFLSGDDSQIDPKSWDEFDLWCLSHGESTTIGGRKVTPWELVERCGHLVSAKRRRELEAQLKELKYHEVIQGGKLVRKLRPQFQEKAPKREPWVVEFPSR